MIIYFACKYRDIVDSNTSLFQETAEFSACESDRFAVTFFGDSSAVNFFFFTEIAVKILAAVLAASVHQFNQMHAR
jgi:hypothetical protein